MNYGTLSCFWLGALAAFGLVGCGDDGGGSDVSQMGDALDGGTERATMHVSTDDAGGETEVDDASTRTCNPVQQRTASSQIPKPGETPSSGLLVCDEGANLTFVVDQLPKKCELIGDAWPSGDAGTPVPCNYDCVSGWCDPVTNDCLLVSECTTDADCSDGSVCLCSVTNGWGFNKCVAADCRTSDDCGAFACAVSEDICQDPELITCHTPADECLTNSDCGDPRFRCAFASDVGAWRCSVRAICE
jgi:hypothetical protein